ncbi:hypothetical protein MMC13_008019 [Lambiella insularis]|nr:hypothetical protein [Lambiella insularis]
MASEVQAAIPKSILKKLTHKKPPTSSTLPPAPPQPDPREARSRAVALEHARLIQQRKDIESSILAATEALLDFPQAPNADPAHPTRADGARLKEFLRWFQPTDYDSLTEERNIDGKCGYSLCPRPHRVEETDARYRILTRTGQKAKGIKVVKKEELERWCCEDCGKRALYIRVQLSEVPAWERAGNYGENIQLYGEHGVGGMAQPEREESLAAITSDLKKLTIERGENLGDKHPTSVEVQVREQITPSEMQESAFQQDDYHESSRIYSSVEGYTPHIGGSRARRRHWEDQLRDSGDIMDTI